MAINVRLTLTLLMLVLMPVPGFATPPHHDEYADPAFTSALEAGLRHFYARDFAPAERDFSRALRVVDDNTLAISFLDAAAAHQPGELPALINAEEAAVAAAPKAYAAHVRLGFAYLFASMQGEAADRLRDARDEFEAASAIAPDRPAAHVGLGIMRFDERSVNRAKIQFLTALASASDDVLAREYLGQLYQSDLRDPRRALSYEITIPNMVPGYADIFFHIGSLFVDLEQPDAALSYVRQGLALDAEHVGEAGRHGQVLEARILIKAGKADEAKRVLRAAVADDADAEIADELLKKIESGANRAPR